MNDGIGFRRHSALIYRAAEPRLIQCEPEVGAECEAAGHGTGAFVHEGKAVDIGDIEYNQIIDKVAVTARAYRGDLLKDSGNITARLDQRIVGDRGTMILPIFCAVMS